MCATKSGLDSILYCIHGGSLQPAVVMLNLRSHGERRGVGLDGHPSCEAEVTTRLGHTTLGLRVPTVAPQAVSCILYFWACSVPRLSEYWQIAVLGTRVPGSIISWTDRLRVAKTLFY